MKTKLRPYQSNDVRRIMRSLKKGRRVMYQLPTGGGKTEIGLAVAKKFIDEYRPVVWITHRIELVDQFVRRAQQQGFRPANAYETGVYSKRALSVQSIGKARNNPPPPNAVLIFDEAHHITARTWTEVAKDHPGYLLGLSATVWRFSKTEGFDHIYDTLLCGPSYSALIEDDYLMAPTVITSPLLAGEKSEVGSTGDYKMGDVVNRLGRAVYDVPLKYWREYCRDKRTIIYAASQAVAIKIAEAIRDEGRSVGLVLSDKELLKGAPVGIETDRMKVADGFADGSIQNVVNVAIITEGVDVPGAEAIIIGRPSKSLNFVRQAAGRTIRTAPGKTEALVIDCGASVLDPQVGWPTGDREWSLKPRKSASEKGEPIVKTCVVEACEVASPASSRRCVGCGAWFGQSCSRCHEFRHGWYFKFGSVPHCDDCQAGIEIESIKNLDKSEDEPTAKWSRNAWKYADRKNGSNANWQRIDELDLLGEWAVVYPAMLPIDEEVRIPCERKDGRVANRRVIPRWQGVYRGEPVTMCEMSRRAKS